MCQNPGGGTVVLSPSLPGEFCKDAPLSRDVARRAAPDPGRRVPRGVGRSSGAPPCPSVPGRPASSLWVECSCGGEGAGDLWVAAAWWQGHRGSAPFENKCCRKRHQTEKVGPSDSFVGGRIYWPVECVGPNSTHAQSALWLDLLVYVPLRPPRKGCEYPLRFHVCFMTQDGEGELWMGSCKGGGISRPLVLQVICLIEPATLASSALL